MMLGLEEQLNVSRHALFDLETIKCAFLSLEEESCKTDDFTVETDRGNTVVIPNLNAGISMAIGKDNEHLLPYNNLSYSNRFPFWDKKFTIMFRVVYMLTWFTD